ncbi:MAG TPA: MFS transporter, partial [Ktedonosporobacter sp.]|nr:MFS transporter [Ktedonosporobacter sp.]
MSPLEDNRETPSHKRNSSASPAGNARRTGGIAPKTKLKPQSEYSRGDPLRSPGGVTILTPGTADPHDKRAALLALAIACIAVFFTALDQTVVVTALPQIINDLQVPITQIDHASWIISAYLLGFIVAMPLMGRVSDIYGRRRIFLLCLLIFGIGSALCGLAPLLGQM